MWPQENQQLPGWRKKQTHATPNVFSLISLILNVGRSKVEYNGWCFHFKSLVSELFIETNHRYVDLLCTSMDTGIYDFGPWQYFDGSIPHMAFKFRAADASDWCISPEKRTLGSSLNIDDPRVICIGTGQGSIDWWWRSDSGSNWWVHLPGATWVCQQVTKGIDNCLHSREDLKAHQVLEATVSSNGRY